MDMTIQALEPSVKILDAFHNRTNIKLKKDKQNVKFCFILKITLDITRD